MSFIRESHPDLVSPDYWSGIDIHDDAQFNASTALNLERKVNEQSRNVAGAVLAQRLGQAMAQGCKEVPLGEWVSRKQSFVPGDGVVMEKECLQRTRHDNELTQRFTEKICRYEE